MLPGDFGIGIGQSTPGSPPERVPAGRINRPCDQRKVGVLIFGLHLIRFRDVLSLSASNRPPGKRYSIDVYLQGTRDERIIPASLGHRIPPDW